MSYRSLSLMVSSKFLLALIGCATAAGLFGQAEVAVPEKESTEAQKVVEEAPVAERTPVPPHYINPCESQGHTNSAPDYEVIYHVPNSTACRYRCRSDDRCVWYTYNWREQKCYLKDIVGEKIISEWEHITGPKKCDFPCFEEFAESDAPPYSYFTSIPDVKTCQEKCNADRRCAWWNYHKDAKYCHLLESQGKTAWRGYSFVSGPPLCDLCERVGQTGTGDDFKTLDNIDGVYTCRAQCRQDYNCYWYTYNKGNRRCFLKKYRGHLQISEPDDITAPRLCRTSCSILGTTDAPHYAFIKEGITSTESCWDRCRFDTQCRWWSYNATKRTCALHAKVGILSIGKSEHFTGPEECETCVIFDKTSNAPDVQVSIVGGSCQYECRLNPECVWYTFNRKDRKCYFKKEEGQLVGAMKPGDITGPKLCDGSM